ncbi:hypothetical protein [Pararhizobium mangrovi]|uniref:Uncharacterized protein n=1 Tax=Pararhizobium mangrovi TaxID=2590452 RepID=A0A506U160_9HYPH|nr:hypothetical protein [Pararhizobium mangrovi]TPW26714.1 hypothetical protein FJU11_14025 [Pararhizobium mangrovi]
MNNNFKNRGNPENHPWGFNQRTVRPIRLSLITRVISLAFLLAVAVLIVGAGLVAYLNVRSDGWGSDAAAWAQVSGSMIAIIGALWIVASEARQARRIRRKQGEEAAWGVRFILIQAQFESQIVAAELTQANEGFDTDDIRSWVQRAKLANLSLETLLTSSGHIHPAVVVTLCNAKILVEQLCSDLQEFQDLVTRGQSPPSSKISDIVNVHASLSALIEHYDARIRGVREALDRGDDMLPLTEWWS